MLISVVIPTYSRAHLLKRLLESIKNQTMQPLEIIVVDDHSKDQASYKKVIEESGILNIRYLTNSKNQGACFSRNQGILAAKGEWIALVDDDDEWESSKIEEQFKKIQSLDEKVGLIYTWTKVVENQKVVREEKPLIKGYALKEILESCFIPSPSVCVKKQALIEAGLFDLSMPSCQDWDMWTRILALGYHCDVNTQFLTLYHKHHQPSIGTSSKAEQGYRLYYQKHIKLYRFYKPWFYLKYQMKKRLKTLLLRSTKEQVS